MRKEDKSTIIEQIAASVKEYGHFYLIDTTAMNAADTALVNFKVDFTLFYFFYSFSNIHSHSATLRIRHQSTRT